MLCRAHLAFFLTRHSYMQVLHAAYAKEHRRAQQALNGFVDTCMRKRMLTYADVCRCYMLPMRRSIGEHNLLLTDSWTHMHAQTTTFQIKSKSATALPFDITCLLPAGLHDKV
jgi:hypothetical protein